MVEVEGHTLRLTGTAEDQYREWRKLLKQLYLEETGAAALRRRRRRRRRQHRERPPRPADSRSCQAESS